MNRLNKRLRLCRGEMIARFDRDLCVKKPALILLPGGPGLGSVYLNPFVAKLGERLELASGILDLPNHGESLLQASRQLSYAECINYVAAACGELAEQSGGLVIIGQSFGARLGFDVLTRPGVRLLGAALVGLPYEFQISDTLLKRLNSLDLEQEVGVPDVEEAHARNWRKIAPTYASKPISPGDFQALVSSTKWIGNERILDAVPHIKQTAKHIDPVVPIGIFQGEFDPVVADRNFERLQELIPQASFDIITGVGHFPMIEDEEETLRALTRFIQRTIGRP